MNNLLKMAVASDRAPGSETNLVRRRHVVVVHQVAILLLQKINKYHEDTRIPLRCVDTARPTLLYQI